jgi:endonuclease YncB( thermonuclease family)
LFISSVSQAQQTLHGKAVKIMDGDTFDLLVDGNTLYRIRLQDIDCPERGQDYYKVAKQALGNYLFNQPIRVVYKKLDKYKRIIGAVYVGTKNINLQMVQNGYAWHFKKYSQDIRFAQAERSAKALSIGLWSQANPIAPWEYRKRGK